MISMPYIVGDTEVKPYMDFENFDSNDFSSPLYYVVDTVSTNIHGPYENEAAFETACEELNVGELSEWICTKSNPNKLKN